MFLIIFCAFFFVILAMAETTTNPELLKLFDRENVADNFIEFLKYTDKEIEEIFGLNISYEQEGEPVLGATSRSRSLAYWESSIDEIYEIIGQFFIAFGEPNKMEKQQLSMCIIEFIEDIGDYSWKIQLRISSYPGDEYIVFYAQKMIKYF